MTADFFMTQIISTSPTTSGSVTLGKPNQKIDVAFLDLLLGQIDLEENDIDLNIGGEALLEGDPLKEKGDLDLLQLALAGQNANENIEAQLADLKLEQLVENRTAQLTKIIDHLTSGLPINVANDSSDLEALIARLQERIESLETKIDLLRGDALQNGEAPFPALIATGLSPAQLTKITDRISAVEEKLGRELTVEDLIAGVGNIIPAPGSEEKLIPSDLLGLANQYQGQEGAEDLLNLATETLPTEQLAQQLNNINVGDEAGAELNPNFLEAQTLSEVDADAAIATGAISNAEFNALKNKVLKTNTLTQANLIDLASSPQPLISGFNGSIALPENWQSYFAGVFEALGIDIDSGLPISPTMIAAHVSTSIGQAGQAHAATQMVASHMTKAAQNGAPTDMTIQLDPPELGRVDIKLEFGPEKTIKASVIVEKPETFLLLQKDAAALERALHNAGLDANGESLNFELASDEYAFNNNADGSQNEANGTDPANQNNDENDIINTTMTWDVDPETGHVHYSILA